MRQNYLRNQILNTLKGNSDEITEVIPLSKLLVALANVKNKNHFGKALCGLYLSGDIEIVAKKREKDEIFFAYNTNKKTQSGKTNISPIDELINTIEIYSRLNDYFDLIDFHQATKSHFKSLELVEFLQSCGANFNHLKLICRYLSAFFSGDMPLTIMELGLSRSELLDVLDQINSNNYLLLNQGLIEINRERGGIYLNGIITPRLLQLVKGNPVTIISGYEKKNKVLYYDIKHTTVKECSLYYNPKEKELFDTIKKLLSTSPKSNQPNVSILLHGAPGTGKTEFAYQLAKNVQADIMQLNFSEIQSKWIGETEKNIRLIFEQYDNKRKASNHPIILLINEADGLMNRRVSVSISNDAFHNHAQTQLLELLEDFKGIVIVTTNLYQNIDEAFHRRFLFRSEISMPNQSTRELILSSSMISTYLSKDLFQKIVEAEWSPAQIKNIEQKIKQLSTIQNIDECLIKSLMMQDEMLQRKRKLGFIQKNNERELSQSDPQSGYIL